MKLFSHLTVTILSIMINAALPHWVLLQRWSSEGGNVDAQLSEFNLLGCFVDCPVRG